MNHASEKKFYVYVDYTTEHEPRPFYVGKGDESRVASLKRNKKHTAIKEKYGLNRKILLETTNEHEALGKEVELISELHTFINDPQSNNLACNMTLGGDGVTGINVVTVQQILDNKVIKTYESIAAVATAFGVKPSTLSNAFKNKTILPTSMRKFEWKLHRRPRRSQKKHEKHGNSIQLTALNPKTNTQKTFNSFTQALDAFPNVTYKYFASHLRQNDQEWLLEKTGHVWDFVDQSFATAPLKKRGNSHQTRVTDVTSGETWDFHSLSAAAIALGVIVDDICLAIKNQRLINEKFLCQVLETSRKKHTRSPNHPGASGTAILAVNSAGDVIKRYKSFAAAERDLNLHNRELYNALTTHDSYTLNGTKYIAEKQWQRSNL